MTITQFLLAAAGCLATLSVGALVLLPRDVTVTRTASVTAPPHQIVALAASNAGYQRFNPYRSTDPELKIALFGPEAGVGSGFRFEGKEGKGQQVVSAVTADQVRYAIDLGPMGKPVQSIRAVPAGDHSDVTWTLEADLGFNPIARVMGLFMDGMVGPTFERGLRNLDTALAAS
ncbi:hypothetical protein FHS89_001166 [Rubricella aquisinus]|uniref:Polyketide cyclase / dehydrase and lipid transport n=1 Tax=Rubricella aquisinus TaxID=2028108 RepID=A0A840WZS7_9RHOB|nr:SRPBCC family protein [Rubricella aquisinus]MBB5515156.1 hypothetical protein [Rubricella aquisinus]